MAGSRWARFAKHWVGDGLHLNFIWISFMLILFLDSPPYDIHALMLFIQLINLPIRLLNQGPNTKPENDESISVQGADHPLYLLALHSACLQTLCLHFSSVFSQTQSQVFPPCASHLWPVWWCGWALTARRKFSPVSATACTRTSSPYGHSSLNWSFSSYSANDVFLVFSSSRVIFAASVAAFRVVNVPSTSVFWKAPVRSLL